MSSSAADIIRARAAALSVSPQIVAQVGETAREAGFPDAAAADRLRKEWLNDLVADLSDEHFRPAAKDPDSHFLEWARQRVREPFHVTYRAVDRVSRLYGSEAGLQLVTVTWPREIASAQRLRKDENQRVAVLAALFLRGALQEPGEMFRKLADTWAAATAESPSLASSGDERSPQEIRLSPDPLPWTPLFLRIADKTYGNAVTDMSRSKLEALAERAARDEDRDLAKIAAARSAAHARRSPLSRMPGVISRAAALGMESNVLLDAERDFLARLELGEIPLLPGTALPYREFIGFLEAGSLRCAAPATKEDEAARRGRVDLLVRSRAKGWIDSLPREFGDFGARRKDRFEQWHLQVAEGVRPAPVDPVVDYGHFLISNPV